MDSFMVKRCLLVGGDDRHKFMANWFSKKGWEVICYGLEKMESLPPQIHTAKDIVPADLIILPIPVTRDGTTINAQYAEKETSIKRFLSLLPKSCLVCGGLIPELICKEFELKAIPYFDYGKSENFALLNAIPTAEGAIEIAIKETPFTLHQAKVCVIGFGRIGKALTSRLLGLGCNVTVTARKTNDLLSIAKSGANALETDKLFTKGPFNIIFNTVPAHVVGKEVMDKQSVDTLIIDLASSPGGVDFDYAKSKKIRTIHALSLPSKCAPVTAANITAKVIYDYISETDG
jgi:dipicolinate synthase subunit A